MSPPRYCVIGAGYSGLAAAKALADQGIAYDHLEATDAIGGNWSHGVYDSTHLISSRRKTEYTDFPMPEHYPDFPNAVQMRDYLRSFADHFGLTGRIEFGAEVTSVSPLDDRGMAGWRVAVNGGKPRDYAGVVVANGHYWQTRVPTYPGAFSGQQIHSKEYRSPADLKGDRVLVVGAGNSGCDLAVEAATSFGTSDLSIRRGYWFLPKYVLGRPTSEYDVLSVPVPRIVEAAVFRALIRVGMGTHEQFGLPKPNHGLFEQDIVVNQQLPYFVRHGRIRVRPEIARLDEETVHFVDGTSAEFDTIVWATGFHTVFPFLPDGLLAWKDGQPLLLERTLPPGLANLYVFGLVAPRSGAGELLTEGARALARMILIQERLPVAMSDILGLVLQPTSSLLAGGPELRWQLRRSRPLLGALAAATRLLPDRSAS